MVSFCFSRFHLRRFVSSDVFDALGAIRVIRIIRVIRYQIVMAYQGGESRLATQRNQDDAVCAARTIRGERATVSEDVDG